MTQPVDASAPGQSDAVPQRPNAATARRRRRRDTPGETAAIWSLAIIGFVSAAVWSSAAPTGLVSVDAAYRGAFVSLMVVAGARARRWSLVLGSGVTAAFAVGPARVGALVALGLIIAMVLLDRRSRVVDALTAGLVGFAALHLEVGGPTGLESVLAVVATAPVLWCAYRYTSKRVQRRWRRGAIAVAVLAIVVTIAAGVGVAMASRNVSDAVASTREGVDMTAEGDGDAAATAFDDAAHGFEKADRSISRVWAAPARLVPVVGPNLAVVSDSVALGADLTQAASAVASDVDFDSVQKLDGGVDLAALAAFEVPVQRAAEAANEAMDTLGGMDSPWIVRPLADRVGQLSDEVADLQARTELAELGVTDGPAMLGADGPRRYLVLLGNPAELRDMGGHVGNWAELVAHDGELDLVDVGGPLELSTPLADAPAWVSEDLPLAFSVLKPTEYPQNWGGDPNTATVSRLASDLYEQRTGRAVDGVVYADTAAFAAFLELTGPVAVPRLPEPYTIDADNAEQFLTRDQFTLFEFERDADAAVVDVIDEVFSKLTNSQLPGPQSLGELFAPLVAGGHLSMGTTRSEDEELVRRLGLAGEVDVPPGGDLLAVLQRNAGPNKIDSFLSRATHVQLQWSPVTGDVRSVVTVELRNDAPSDGFNRLVIGNDAGASNGSNVTDVAVLTPFMLQSVEVDGQVVAAQPLLEKDYWRHTVRVVVPPQSSRTVTFEMFGQVAPGNDYDLAFYGQPIMGDNTLDVDLRSTGEDAKMVTTTGAKSTETTSGVDAGSDYVFSWRSGK